MVFHPHIALLAILMTTSTVTAQEKTRIYLGASTKTRLLPSLGRHEERFLRAARPRYSTRSLARNADDSAGIGRGFVAFRLPRAGTLYRRSRASAQFHYHWGRHQRHRSIHHCRHEVQKLRRFTGRDLWHPSLTSGHITALREALKSGGLSIRVIISCRSLPPALRQTLRHLSRSNYSNVSSSSKLTSLRELQTRVALEKS